MKVRLHEAVWKHRIEQGLANRFRTALDNDDVDGAVTLSIELLNACKPFFDPEEQDYVLNEIDELIESFEDVEHEYDEVDFLLDELYDFCDGYNIWIPLPEEDIHPEGETEPEETDKTDTPADTPAEDEAPEEGKDDNLEEDAKTEQAHITLYADDMGKHWADYCRIAGVSPDSTQMTIGFDLNMVDFKASADDKGKYSASEWAHIKLYADEMDKDAWADYCAIAHVPADHSEMTINFRLADVSSSAE